MKIFLAIFAGMVIGFMIGYMTCAIFSIGDISSSNRKDNDSSCTERDIDG